MTLRAVSPGAGGGGGGTVTSVGLTMPATYAVAGSPVTGSGTFAVTYANQAVNTVFAGPTVGSGVPSFRSLVAADIPNLDTSKLTTGILGVARGGTGAGTLTANGVLLGNGTSAVTAIAPVAAGSRLVSTGVGSAPAWQTPLYGQVFLSANQSVTTAVITKINFDTAQIDPAGMWDGTNFRFLPKRAGTYRVSAQAMVSVTTAAASTYVWYIYKNGTAYAQANQTSAFVGASGQKHTFNVLVPMNGTTDYIEMHVLISGTTPVVTGNASILLTHLGIEYIGP